MTNKSKNIIVSTIVVIFVIAIAAGVYLYVHKHGISKSAQVVQSQTTKWVNITKPNLPPFMITGVPISTSIGEVVLDRYYKDKNGTIHGEYSFNVPINKTNNQELLYSDYLTDLKKFSANTIVSSSPSLISLTQPDYVATIAFTNPTAQVDVIYTYSLILKAGK